MSGDRTEAGNEPTTNNSYKKWTTLFSANRLFSKDNGQQFIQPEDNRVALGATDVDTIQMAIGNYLVG